MSVRTTKKQLTTFLEHFSAATRALVLTHNDPDPDALASAYGVATLLRAHRRRGQRVTLAYGGTLGRPENQALARFLRARLHHGESLDLAHFDFVALVDAQPGQGNHLLPESMTPTAVIDHHPRLLRTSEAAYVDVRPSYGATSTIVWEYLYVDGIRWTPQLATALFYGIRTDTLGLARAVSDADVRAYTELLPHVDQAALAQIEQAPLPRTYYRMLGQALARTRLHGFLVITEIGNVRRPDIVAELADLLIRMQGIQYAVAMAVHNEMLILSVRTRNASQSAGQLVRRAVGERGTAGGHGTMAAGRIPLVGRDTEVEITRLRNRLIELTEAPTRGRRLVTGVQGNP